jgi:hypothetical protein
MTATNQQRLFITRREILLITALLCAAGCQHTGYRKGDAASESLQRAALEIQGQSKAIDVAVGALTDLVTHPAPDLKPQFKRFSVAIDRLEDTVKRTERTRERMELKTVEYFQTWDKETADIHYGIVRDQSETRRAQVTNQFESVNARYLEAQGVVRPLLSYLNDIRTTLSVDLTPAGLNSVQGIASNAENNARKVQVALAKLSDELKASGAGWSSAAAQNQADTSAAMNRK